MDKSTAQTFFLPSCSIIMICVLAVCQYFNRFILCFTCFSGIELWWIGSTPWYGQNSWNSSRWITSSKIYTDILYETTPTKCKFNSTLTKKKCTFNSYYSLPILFPCCPIQTSCSCILQNFQHIKFVFHLRMVVLFIGGERLFINWCCKGIGQTCLQEYERTVGRH